MGRARLWRRPSCTRRKAARKSSSSFSISQTKANAKSRCVLNSRPHLLVWLRRTNGNSRNHSNGSRSANFSDTRSNSAAGCANIFSSIATSSARRIWRPTLNWSRFALISCVHSDSPKKISWSGSATANSGLISSATRTCRLSGGTIYCKRSINPRASRVRKPQRNSGTSPIPSLRR